MSVTNDAAARAAAEAARRAAEARRRAEEARRKAAEQARQRQAEAQRRAAAAARAAANAKKAAAPKKTAQAAKLERSRFQAPPVKEKGKGAGVPRTPEDVARAFPELKDAPKEKLRAVHGALAQLAGGGVPDKIAALGTLTREFPGGTQRALERLGVQDNRLARIVAKPGTLEAAATLGDAGASPAKRAEAALRLAQATAGTLAPGEVKGLVGGALKGLPAAEKLAGAVAAWTDPSASGFDKAQATLGLAGALRDVAGKSFPELAPALRRLEGPLRGAGAAVTLLDPSASAGDRALAAAQLAAELPDLRKDVSGFADLLRAAGVKDADRLAGDAAQGAVKGLSPALAARLSPAELSRLDAVAARVAPERLAPVLGNVTDKAALEALTGQLETLEPAAGGRLLDTVAGLERGVLQRTLKDAGALDSLGRLATKLDDGSAGVLARAARDLDADGLKALLRFADAAPAAALREGLKVLGPVVDKAGGKVLGQSLKALDGLLSKMGVEVTAEVAGKAFKSLAKVVPLVGAVPSAVDAVKLAKESAELKGLNKDLGFLALAGAGLNTVDTVGGLLLDFTGVGAAVDVPASVLLGTAELALELGLESEKKKLLADPKGYEAPGWVKGVNLAYAAAQPPQPSGLVSLVGYYGPKESAELIGWGVKTGAKGAAEAARWAASRTLGSFRVPVELAAGVARHLEDVARDPARFGRAAADAAREGLRTTLRGGRVVGEAAVGAVRTVADAADGEFKVGKLEVDLNPFR